jgi:alanine racemase
MFTISQILDITQGKAIALQRPEAAVQHLLTDSRKVSFPETSLFFAIRGDRHDGHTFIAELIQKGVRNFIVEHPIDSLTIQQTNNSAINLIQVKNTLQALQQIAAAHRRKFTYPVIGITGSNGKTIVKEWLAQLLAPDFSIVKSPKSYNSQIGVPLSVWQMTDKHNLAIFEAGISQVGEMEKLAEIIQPTIGVLTNIGSAHDEGFESRARKIEEKLKLFQKTHLIYAHPGNGLVLDKESHYHYLLKQNFRNICADPDEAKRTVIFELEIQGNSVELTLPFYDDASLDNALTCLNVLLHFEIPLAEIQARFNTLKPISMRLQMKQAIHDSYVIDDSYNNDLSGLEMALAFLALQQQKPNKAVILSDMLETHLKPEDLYLKITELLQQHQINTLVGIGEQMMAFQKYFDAIPTKHFFLTTQDFLNHPLTHSLTHALILVKGARKFQFERIAQALQQKTHGTVLEINLDALTHNLNFYRSLLAANVKLMVMVKAFAYGSGSTEVAQWLQYHRVDYLGVAYTDEGIFLRQNGVTLPIMVLNPQPETFGSLLEYDLEPELYSFGLLKQYLDFLKSHPNYDKGKTYHIHLKIDTGMRRLGFEVNEITRLCEVLAQRLPWNVGVASVFSHLAGADEAKHTDFSEQQITAFREATAQLEETLGYTFLKHILNSPGIVRFPQAQFDMVRLGIGLYGVEATNQYQAQLAVVGTLKTTISQIKHIQQGETVGYGRGGVAERDSTIATIAIGYADGFSRKLGNAHYKVSVNGQSAPTIGRVCMDMSMIDITGIQAQEGDEVVIFGESPTLFDFAEAQETIAYEVLTMVSERVKRVFFME